jgi:hypothetical protein
MAEVLVKCGVKREPGYLYFVDKKGNVARAKMARGRKKKGKVKQQVLVKCGIKRAAGWLYFLDKKGNVARVKMARRGKKR